MLGLFKKSGKLKGLVGVSVDTTGIAVAHIEGSSADKIQLKACEYGECQGAKAQLEVLTQQVNKMGLQGASANFILSPSQYSLLLIEPPEVPEEELTQAVRWRIKDLVDFNVNEAALDIVRLPADAFRGRQQMIYVVAAARAVVDAAEDLVNNAGMQLKYIDVAETSLCNLLNGFDTESHGCALMFLKRGEGIVNLVKNHSLYLTRRIKADLSAVDPQELASSNAFNHLLLETQRSLDYYESQLGQIPATELLLLPVGELGGALGDALNANLGLNAHMLNLPEYLPGAEALSMEFQHQCLLAIAAGLRREAL